MPRYVAFLRAINVGGHVVKMERLRALFEELKFTSVETLIASGNVLFDAGRRGAPTAESAIETHLRKALGYEVATFIRTPDELRAIAALQPFGPIQSDDRTTPLYVGFFRERLSPAMTKQLARLESAVDTIHVEGREVYWIQRRAFGESSIAAGAIEKLLQVPGTFRNIRTVHRLVERCD